MAAKRAIVEPDHRKLSIRRQCELILLSRASYYRTPAQEPEENQRLMRLIDEAYTRDPSLGSRGMRGFLKRRGIYVNRKRVQRLMRMMGLASVAPRKKTTIRAKGHRIYPYLLRNLDINRPDQVWAADITYVRLRRSYVFLVAVMDWHSRYVLSWEVRAMDNIMIERLWRTVKYHHIYLRD